MGCNCGPKASKVKYELRLSNGEVLEFNTKPEAQVAAARKGGVVREVAKS